MGRAERKAEGPAFVLGGGGALGAYEVGMLKALFAAGVRPGMVLGTSVGAINGAAVAAEPSGASVGRLIDLWTGLGRAGVFTGSLVGRVTTAVRSRTHLYTPAPLRELLATHLPVARIEELAVPFQCVAASIELAAEHWFDRGPLVEAVLASSAVPGLLPPVGLDGEHFVDGGLVNSIPVGRAVALGAREIYVLQVGRIERPLTPPRLPWQVATVAFEIARRHRFARDMADLPPDVTVHVLPSGAYAAEASGGTLSQLRHRAFGQTADRIERAYAASARYLDTALASGGGA
ncbi:patatin-like phospholipase family protein [Actinacidiphila epipremni]|uniref:Patatin-like phospholipase family protein n=1 Tax=Actinacidiphila epipremni TaxID=2053013 RepID=A0ABX0ZR01_9ACTN|nr:patatin-like phospholipase family protein [Actinacidiphila epipremni]NJP43988.1 patatin-like phospholipase family protein [Actinacidiphila epipremni]